MDDPFPQVRATVASTLQRAERQHSKWSEARRRKPVRHDECKNMLIDLLSMLDNLEADLEDLEGAVNAVVKARSRFPHLTDAEVESRQTFVRCSKRATQSIREDVSTVTPTKSARCGKKDAEERAGLLASPSSAGAAKSKAATPPVAGLTPASDVDMAHRAHVDMELGQHQAMQQSQLEQQDETLDALHGAVGRLKSIGREMNEEITSQQRMLNELGENLDNASNAMASLKDKMKQMMAASKKERGKFCAIIVLSGLLVLLTWMVVSG